MRLLRRACLVLVLLLACVAPALAHPALWVAKDADTTAYLFGTVHLLPDDSHWRFAALDQALDDSDALYIEMVDDDALHMQALVLRYGLDLGHPLSSRLTPAEQATLAQAAATLGLPGGAQALEVMRPWLAGLTLAVTPLLKAGLDPEQGVDKLLRKQMEASGKPVRGLETAEQQIRFLADMPPTLEMDFLRSTLRDFGKGGGELRALVDAWKRGDVASLARAENEDMRQSSPPLYQRLLVARNADWARQIAAMMKLPGTVFIAVGAAHLAGPDSVQVQLERRGVTVKRL